MRLTRVKKVKVNSFAVDQLRLLIGGGWLTNIPRLRNYRRQKWKFPGPEGEEREKYIVIEWEFISMRGKVYTIHTPSTSKLLITILLCPSFSFSKNCKQHRRSFLWERISVHRLSTQLAMSSESLFSLTNINWKHHCIAVQTFQYRSTIFLAP